MESNHTGQSNTAILVSLADTTNTTNTTNVVPEGFRYQHHCIEKAGITSNPFNPFEDTHDTDTADLFLPVVMSNPATLWYLA